MYIKNLYKFEFVACYKYHSLIDIYFDNILFKKIKILRNF